MSAIDWLAILATGVVCFGLRPREVWKLTAAQFAAMSRAFHEERKLQDLQFAWLRQLVTAPYRKKGTAVPKVQEFALFADVAEDRNSGAQSPEDQLCYVRNFLVPYLNARAEWEDNKGG